MTYKDRLTRYIETLPAGNVVTTLNEALGHDRCAVVTAPPGAGKSTLLPLTMLDAAGHAGKILMLEPRRLAARQIAERMAYMLGERVGETVGYRVRMESRVSAQTRIEVLTEGVLTRMLIDDPTLDGVSAVVFDEFHERSLTSDVALALTREAQDVIRPDLRIVIMSATIDATMLCRQLSARLIESEGRLFPIRDICIGDAEASDLSEADPLNCADAVARAVRVAHDTHHGDILAFLPGQGDILRCQAILQDVLSPTRVYALYGMQGADVQRLAIAPSPSGQRKVVLATPVAETSLTIEGVRVVIDSGLCRRPVYDGRSAMQRLETVRVSHDMAQQRRGRAGRVAEGVYYRLWTRATDLRMPDCRQPEIMTADLTQMLLDVGAWGGDAGSLQWLTPPPASSVAHGQRLLGLLGAVDDRGCLTSHGRALASLPCHPRIAQMLVRAATPRQRALAADIAAILDEKDLMSQAVSADITLRIEELRKSRASGRPGRWERIIRMSDQYRRLIKVPEDNSWPDTYEAGGLIAAAWPERVAVSAGPETYRLASGDTVAAEAADHLTSYQYLAVALSGSRIFMAAPLSEADAQSMAVPVSRIAWDRSQGRVLAQEELRIGRIVLGVRPMHDVSRDVLIDVVCQAAQKEGLSMFSFTDDVSRLQCRIAQVALWHADLSLPDVTTDGVLATVSEWLPLYAVRGLALADLRSIDMCQVVWGMLSYDQQQAVDRLAPSHIQVPTGSRIRVDYRQGAEAPVLSVRLQECFGLSSTPCVDDGRRPVLMELLSPGYKPVQLTSDLSSFWQNTYFEVRKELRRRYPKHCWPDNPLEAKAVRK